MTIRDIHLIISNQFEAMREKPKDKVGFAGTGWANHQDRLSFLRYAASVHPQLPVHNVAI